MREKNVPAVRFVAAGHDRIQRDTGQIADRALLVFLQRERYEPRFRRNDLEPELFRNAVSPIGCTEIGVGQPARGNDQRLRGECPVIGRNGEALFFLDPRNLVFGKDLYARLVAFFQEHGENSAGTGLAEELACFLFVVLDIMLLHEREKVARREPGKRRPAELGVAGEIMFGSNLVVREITPSAA